MHTGPGASPPNPRRPMRGRAPLISAVPVLANAILLSLIATLGQAAGAAEPPAAAPPPPTPLPTLAIPAKGAYAGVYADFGDSEEEVTAEKIDAFTAAVGKHQALIAFSNHWGTGQFPAAQVQIIDHYGAAPLIYWNPWQARDDMTSARFDLGKIEAGDWDAYIDAWAHAARDFGKPLLVAWGLEMNGTWFPWCGVFHGGGEPVPGSAPVRHQGPEAFKRAYRHVLDRARAAGASNISWVFQTNNTPDPNQPWNTMAAYYPGDDYVDWLGMSAYGKQYPGNDWTPLDETFLGPYAQLHALNRQRPIVLAEWGIAEFPEQGNKAEWLHEAFARMEHDLPRLKGAIFWHERWQNGDGRYSNLRVDSSPAALTAYRAGVAHPFWLAEPHTATPAPPLPPPAAR